MITEKGEILASVWRVDQTKKFIGITYENRHSNQFQEELTREQANALSRALQCFLFDGLKEVTVYKQLDGEVTTSMFTQSGVEL